MLSFVSCNSEKTEKESQTKEIETSENTTEATAAADEGEAPLKNVEYKSFECTGDYCVGKLRTYDYPKCG